MKSKTIFSIVAFFSAFTLSAILFGSESNDFKVNVQPKTYSFETDYSAIDSDLQIEMRRFLDEDKRNGLIYYGEIAGMENKLSAQIQPTAKLVGKMQKMNCTNLPNDFCADWKAHVQAWKNLSIMLNRVARKNFDSDEINENYSDANEQINDSYQNLLDTAQNYDVDYQ